jgi:hypothetical protein
MYENQNGEPFENMQHTSSEDMIDTPWGEPRTSDRSCDVPQPEARHVPPKMPRFRKPRLKPFERPDPCNGSHLDAAAEAGDIQAFADAFYNSVMTSSMRADESERLLRMTIAAAEKDCPALVDTALRHTIAYLRFASQRAMHSWCRTIRRSDQCSSERDKFRPPDNAELELTAKLNEYGLAIGEIELLRNQIQRQQTLIMAKKAEIGALNHSEAGGSGAKTDSSPRERAPKGGNSRVAETNGRLSTVKALDKKGKRSCRKAS